MQYFWGAVVGALLTCASLGAISALIQCNIQIHCSNSDFMEKL
jgi:hypothetical protein